MSGITKAKRARRMLRAERKAAGASLRDTAGALGVAHVVLWQWEAGMRRIPPSRMPDLVLLFPGMRRFA